MNACDAAVAVSSLKAGYGDSIVFKDISFAMSVGEVISIMGPSGSGKSTLLRVLSGLKEPLAGSFRMNLPKGKRATLMFQSPLLQPWLTVRENVRLPAQIQGEDVDDNALLSAVGLGHYGSRYPFQLSGGEQRRVALARALGSAPSLLLLDEPFTGVDELTRERLFQLLGEVVHRRQISSILVTHNPYEAVYLADRVVLLGGDPTTVCGVVDIPFPHPRPPSFLETRECIHLVGKIRGAILDGVRSGVGD